MARARARSGGVNWEKMASQLMGRLRGDYGQREFSRLLGYRANVALGWEDGSRFPAIGRMLEACRVVGIDVAAVARAFAPECDAKLGRPGRGGISVAAWLNALRGEMSVLELAKRSGISRFAVGRWLLGRTQPRLPDFLRLVHAMTRRVSEWACAIVGGDRVPEVDALHRQLQGALRAEAKRVDQRRRLNQLRTRFALKRLDLPHQRDFFDSVGIGLANMDEARVILRDANERIRALAAERPRVGTRALVNLQLVVDYRAQLVSE